MPMLITLVSSTLAFDDSKSHFRTTLHFYSRSSDRGLLQALDLVREIHAGIRRKLPDTAPTEFIPDTWRSYVIEAEGYVKIDKYLGPL